MRPFILLVLCLCAFLGTAQTKIVKGNVFAFNDLELNNIAVVSKKDKTVAYTDHDGNFSIECRENDRLKFTGKGFQKVIIPVKHRTFVMVKMIYNGGEKSKSAAVSNHHVSATELEQCLASESAYNLPESRIWHIQTTGYKEVFQQNKAVNIGYFPANLAFRK